MVPSPPLTGALLAHGNPFTSITRQPGDTVSKTTLNAISFVFAVKLDQVRMDQSQRPRGRLRPVKSLQIPVVHRARQTEGGVGGATDENQPVLKHRFRFPSSAVRFSVHARFKGIS